MQKVNSFIGKDLLEMLMFSMYPDAKIIYREYVQNAFDAINTAVEEKVLNKVRDGVITITIDSDRRNISIKDNGTGISSNHALTILTSIADSQKDGIERAGVYGIGRLVGAGYCSKLEFRTSAAGEDTMSIISFDVDKTRKILDDESDKRPANEVINAIVTFDSIETDRASHFFEVILHNVKEDYPILLSEDEIIEYLKEVAPIDYEMPFKNNIMYNSMEPDSEYERLQKGLKCVQIAVNRHTDIRKRYGNTVVGTGDEIIGLEYFMLKDNVFGKLAWGWFAVTKFSKAIPSSDVNRGIRLRKLNIQVGEANYLNEYFDEARGNNYFYGEIHVVHPNLRPNTSRAGLTPTIEATCFFEELKKYFRGLKSIYHLASMAKSAARDTENASTKINQQNLSEKEKKDIQADLSTGLKKMESAKKAAATLTAYGTVANKILQQYQPKVDNVSEDKDAPTSVDVKESEREESAKWKEKGSVDNNQPQDIFQSLMAKYHKEQVWIIRRIFKTLSDNCPKSQLPLIEDLKRMVIKDLENQ